jgi:uncharacterized protein with HEPN domain
MKQQREYIDYLRDILDAAQKAVQFVAGMDSTAFEGDAKTSFAVIRALEIIGEAAKHLPASVRQRYPEVPWRAMSGMCDKVIHDYLGVSLQRVYETVRQDVPALRSAIAPILADLEKGGRIT